MMKIEIEDVRERDLKRRVHCNSEGLWFFRTAMTNLEKEEELIYDKKTRLYSIQEGE